MYPGNLASRTVPADRARDAVYFAVGCPGLDDLSREGRNRLEILDRARHVSVRDSDSKQVLSRYIERPMEVFADPGWRFEPDVDDGSDIVSPAIRWAYNTAFVRTRGSPRPADSGTTDERVGVVLRNGFDFVNLPPLREELRRLSARFELYFIPFAPQDTAFYRRHFADLDMVCFRAAGPQCTYRRVESMDRVVAMRYHSLIFAALAGSHTTWQVGYIRTPPRRAFLYDDGIAHKNLLFLEPGLLEHIIQGAGRYINIGFPGYRHGARLVGVPELTMTPALSELGPSGRFDMLDQFLDLHSCPSLVSVYTNPVG
jgi:hypothetical protein